MPLTLKPSFKLKTLPIYVKERKSFSLGMAACVVRHLSLSLLLSFSHLHSIRNKKKVSSRSTNSSFIVEFVRSVRGFFSLSLAHSISFHLPFAIVLSSKVENSSFLHIVIDLIHTNSSSHLIGLSGIIKIYIHDLHSIESSSTSIDVFARSKIMYYIAMDDLHAQLAPHRTFRTYQIYHTNS